jgi:MoaA/NifB/PqqE/SkfB family radical SAM enzyme
MNPCSCAGINIIWYCNAKCKHCFYRRNENLGKDIHRTFSEIMNEVLVAKARGCNRIVLVGQGEPLFHPFLKIIISDIFKWGMHSNIITNGTMPVRFYEDLFLAGLNHLQISVHALGEQLDTIMEHKGAGRKQDELMSWLKENNLSFRTNTSLQQLNYNQLPEIIQYLIDKGAFHIALLGFLPHYEWKEHVAEVAVHPAELRPYIEKSADLLIAANKFFTIRYHPFCHLSPKYWKYVVNARYVLYDPWEWDYGHYDPDWGKVWPAALAMGENVAIQGEPCKSCAMRPHCGGWNKYYAEAFQGGALASITQGPQIYWSVDQDPGGLHDMNPANRLKGYCIDGRPV